jgi:hypothetical protein
LRIDREGVWRHEGQEVTHPGVLQNLYANLCADGRTHYLQVGPARIPVAVDDAPFVVHRVEVIPEPGAEPALTMYLSDGTTERLEPDGLWIGRNQAPYCRVKGGRFVARLAVPAWLQLARFVEETAETGTLTLTVGDRRVELRPRSA